MNIRDRVKSFTRVAKGELRANPKNWRTHPKAQRDAFKGVLAEVGFAGAVLAYEAQASDASVKKGLYPAGALVLIDGHLRDEETPKDFMLPVLVLDVNEAEADKLLATYDPLSGLAGQDDSKLVELLSTVDSDSAAIQKMLADLVDLPKEEKEPTIAEKWEILVTCESESQQAEILQQLMDQGLACRSLIS